MTIGLLVTWMMVFLRTLGIFLQLPVLTNRPLPVTVRLGICLCVATLLSATLPEAPVPATLGQLVGTVASELILGLAMGFVGRLCFGAVEMAGRVIATEIGVSATPGMGVPEPSQEAIAAMLMTFAVVLFFMFGGHLMMVSALARSFAWAPAGAPMFVADAGDTIIRATSRVIELGVRMAAPFIAMNFLVTMTFSILGRVVPKMNVYLVSFSMRVIAGFTLLASAGALLARYLYTEFGEVPLRMLELTTR